ncbi:MAG: hypothetical protein HN919_07715 [Verrucomicrobia bacterium]|jgi:hypothetical protein|nr:hypothetical protein [Verrucomicrobiota bacterium]
MKNITLEHFEQIEVDVEECCNFLDTENYPGLVQHWRDILARDPSDVNAVLSLAEAFVLNSQYQDAITMLTPYYTQTPEQSLYAHAILDALFAMGKTSQDFSWKSEPLILELTADILDTCHRYLKPKRKPRSVTDLYFFSMPSGYLHFTDEDLLQALIDDERFVVTCDNTYESGISVVRKHK